MKHHALCLSVLTWLAFAHTGAKILRTVAPIATAEFDALSTRRMVRCPGLHETNPIVRPFARNAGVFFITSWDVVVPRVLARRAPAKWHHLPLRAVLRTWEAYSSEEHVRLGIENIRMTDRYRRTH